MNKIIKIIIASFGLSLLSILYTLSNSQPELVALLIIK